MSSTNNKWFGFLFYGVIAVIFLIVVFVILYGTRWFNAATVQSKLIHPKENVECVVVTTTDGAAVDCWKLESDDE